jgi:hypothetical protein
MSYRHVIIFVQEIIHPVPRGFKSIESDLGTGPPFDTGPKLHALLHRPKGLALISIMGESF